MDHRIESDPAQCSTKLAGAGIDYGWHINEAVREFLKAMLRNSAMKR